MWEDELKKMLHKLQLDYYEHGVSLHTIVPYEDIKPIIDKVHSLLKDQREICAGVAKPYMLLDENMNVVDLNDLQIQHAILNAPEPELK
jgi:hypothetical protein